MKQSTRSGVGHSIINPLGQIISVSKPTFDELQDRGYLHRDKASGLWGMDPKQSAAFLESEKGSPYMREIGSDFSGPNVVVCNCGECYEAIDIQSSRESRIKSELLIAGLRQAIA
jgi:hypothetical protein